MSKEKRQHQEDNAMVQSEDQKILEMAQEVTAAQDEDEGRPLQLRVNKQGETSNDPAQFTGQFADQFLTKSFTARWSTMLWTAMQMSGNGYKKESMKHTGRGADRRGDKIDGNSKLMRQYQARYQ
jgi:hypothetical protein